MPALAILGAAVERARLVSRGRSVAPETSLLSQLFDLTVAEVRVAKRAAEGETGREIAARPVLPRS